jgi:hypothetical protein
MAHVSTVGGGIITTEWLGPKRCWRSHQDDDNDDDDDKRASKH